jgi:hypothetical protein
MTVTVTQPSINVREKLAELDKPTGIAGEAMLRAETPQEQFNLIGAGRRNLIINGDMRIAQRGTSHTTTSAYTLDRWKFQTDLLDQYAHTVTQSSDAPDGFFNSFKIEVTTTETTVESTEDLAVTQFIEAQDCQALAAGTSSAKPLSLSFWVKSSVTGTFAVALTAIDDNKIFPTTYTVNSANTWEYKTIDIPPCTIATIDNDNGQGLSLRFITLSGSSYTSGSTGTWQSYSSTLFAAGHQAQISTDGDTWQITGVQLELGKVATPFEHRSYGEELALCQRYFSIPVNNVDEDGNSNTISAIGVGRGASSGAVVVWALHAPVPMRDRPDIVSSGSYYITDGTSRTSATPTQISISQYSSNSSLMLANYQFSSAVCDDDRVNMVGAHTAVKITLDAEL